MPVKILHQHHKAASRAAIPELAKTRSTLPANLTGRLQDGERILKTFSGTMKQCAHACAEGSGALPSISLARRAMRSSRVSTCADRVIDTQVRSRPKSWLAFAVHSSLSFARYLRHHQLVSVGFTAGRQAHSVTASNCCCAEAESDLIVAGT